MSKHVAALGFLHVVLGLLAGLFGGVVLLVGFASIGAFLREVLEVIGYGHLLRWLGAGFAASLLLAAGLLLTTAYGLFRHRPWGRLLALLGALSQVMTLSWPALLGLYGFWVLLSEDGARLFRGRA